MGALGTWWEGLSAFQMILAAAAIPATVVLILQTILLLFGLGHGNDTDADHADSAEGFDNDHDCSADHTDGHDAGHQHGNGIEGLRIFTVRGIISFFAVGGWFGIFLIDVGASDVIA